MPSLGRKVVLFAALCLAAACGDSDVDLNGVEGSPRAGFFIGNTEHGGDFSMEVGSIRAIFIECGSNDATVVFDPPEPIAGDGSFAVEFTDGGRDFHVTGRFDSQNHVQGTISGDADCNGSFEAFRCDDDEQSCGDSDGDGIPDEIDPDEGPARTPTRTPTPAGNNPTATPTPTTGGVATATVTPTVARTLTPTPMRTSTGLCGNGMVDIDEGEVCDPTANPIVDAEELGCESSVTCFCFDFFCEASNPDNDDINPIGCNLLCRIDFDMCDQPFTCEQPEL